MGGLDAGLQVAARWNWNNCRRDTCAMKDLSISLRMSTRISYGMTMYISGGFFPPWG